MKLKHIVAAFIIILIFTSCKNETTVYENDNSQFSESEVYFDPSAPVIEFSAKKYNDNAVPEYFLFDDNPEHLNPKFLADGENPNAIAHFENLSPGIYTVFSYHHRGDSVPFDADLYYDTAFSSNNNAEIEILAIGLDHDWDWNQAWADYTNTNVLMPEYIKSIDCTCGKDCPCLSGDGICQNNDCPAIVRNEYRDPKTNMFDHLNSVSRLSENTPLLLSEFIQYIDENELNHFRYGGYDEPMWLMMKFRVISGNIDFDTIAYQNKQTALYNLKSGLSAPFENEPQYKGIAYNAPIMESEFDYTIDNDTPTGSIPVTVKNARVPNGCTIKNGIFATNVNTWREKYPIAAESDLMMLEYTDDTKCGLYGDKINEHENIWYFDAYHTKIYSNEYNKHDRNILSSYNIKTDGYFQPNQSMDSVIHPLGNEISDNDFYKYTACNLGNFGVTTKYKINIENISRKDRIFDFKMKSIAGQVYRFCQTDVYGNIIKSDDGNYYMKRFDYDPAEDPNSKSNPKSRITPPEHSSNISFEIKSGEKYTIEIEITTLTGCTAPMHNLMSII